MKHIYDIDGITIDSAGVNTGNWTTIIPAAGRGTRLGYKLPKVLYEVAGHPMLYWLLRLFAKTCSHIVVVSSPEGYGPIYDYLKKKIPDKFSLIIQDEPKGMAHAVLLTKEKIHTKYCMVVWGDQVLLKENTITICQTMLEKEKNGRLILPTIIKKKPYIHFVRESKSQKIISVMQAREREIPFESGENDCGLFLFKTDDLFSLLQREFGNRASIGEKTGEFNLLPLIPYFDDGSGGIITVRINDEDETLGVNTREEGDIVTSILRKRYHAE